MQCVGSNQVNLLLECSREELPRLTPIVNYHCLEHVVLRLHFESLTCLEYCVHVCSYWTITNHNDLTVLKFMLFSVR